MWLKRVPNYNHDFLAAWLNISNVLVALYLGGFQAYAMIERAKNEEDVPRIWVFLILSNVRFGSAGIFGPQLDSMFKIQECKQYCANGR